MITFMHRRTGEVKQAYSVRYNKDGDSLGIKFTEDGTEYFYSKDNVFFLNPDFPDTSDKQEENTVNKAKELIVYSYESECYKCHQKTRIITYVVFDDGTNDNVTYPWDKKRALENQNIEAHMRCPEIEFYGIHILGQEPELDKILLEKYPENIAIKYSNTVKRSYAMNLCDCCKAGQGHFYVYYEINRIIQKKKQLTILDKLQY